MSGADLNPDRPVAVPIYVYKLAFRDIHDVSSLAERRAGQFRAPLTQGARDQLGAKGLKGSA